MQGCLRIIFIVFVALVTAMNGVAQLPAAYNIIWNSPSRDAGGSMPCGGGDIGMNVWVEQGEVLVYLARSGQFDENNGLLKSGRIRIKLTPNPLEGGRFRQQLHLQEGYVTISGERDGIQTTLKLYSEIFSPVVRIELESSKPVAVMATYENWRYKDRVVTARENFGNSYKWAGPKGNIIRGDSIRFEGDGVRFYHHNKLNTIFEVTVAQQGLDTVKEQLFNPLRYLAFGGHFGGKNFKPAGENNGIYTETDFKGWQLQSVKPSRQHSLTLVQHSLQSADISHWHRGVDSLWGMAARNKSVAANATLNWWKQFWQRSFIMIDSAGKDTPSWEVGRNYQLFRYMLACNAYGQWPTKFNGGLLTVDPRYTDSSHKGLTPDYRNWGGGLHTMQNQRLVYFPMIRSGDFDMMQPQLEFYLRLQRTAEIRSKVYWGHGGACFTEQMEQFGLPNYAEYGTNRPDWFDKGVEYNAWLEYEWDTVFEFCLMMLEEHAYTGKDISGQIPFIISCLQFFDEHYQYLAKRRGSKALDQHGKIVIYPGSGAETFKMAYNPTSTTTALHTICRRLFFYFDEKWRNFHHASPSDSTGKVLSQQADYVMAFMQRIPYPAFADINGKTAISPAQTWERVNNTESPQLYPVFPWGMFGIGRPGLDTALNTWHFDTLVQKFRSHVGWKQDNIWAARLGLTEAAWRLTSLKLQNSGRRFPAFWGPGFDWVPDHNWGGSGMIGLQEMLLQTVDDSIYVLPAWPRAMDVHFRLHAPKQTIVEVRYRDGIIQSLRVTPESRRKDVVLPAWMVK